MTWFNSIFPKVFPAQGDTLMGTVAYTPCKPAPEAKGAGAGVQLSYFRKGDHESEVAIVEQIVRDTLKDHPSDTIGILVRSRTRIPRRGSQPRAGQDRYRRGSD